MTENPSAQTAGTGQNGAAVGPQTTSGSPPSTSPAPPAPARPDWLLPKYKTVEEQARAYVDLERRMGSQGGAPQPAAAPQNGHAAPDFGPTADGAIVPPAPPSQVNFREAVAPFAKTWAEQGRLTDAQYAQLQATGRTRDEIDGFFAGQSAMVKLRVREAHDRVGGEQAFNAMTAWAGANLTPAEIQRFNAARLSQDPTEFGFLVDAVRARWQAATGATPQNPLVGSGGSASTGVVPYDSHAAYAKDIASPEYQKDPDYRRRCDARAAVSPFIAAFNEMRVRRSLG